MYKPTTRLLLDQTRGVAEADSSDRPASRRFTATLDMNSTNTALLTQWCSVQARCPSIKLRPETQCRGASVSA